MLTNLASATPLQWIGVIGAVFGGISAIWLLLTAGRRWFLRREFFVQVAIVLSFTAAGGYFGVRAYDQLRDYADFLVASFETPLMTNDGEYRAIESFLLKPFQQSTAGFLDQRSRGPVSDKISDFQDSFRAGGPTNRRIALKCFVSA